MLAFNKSYYTYDAFNAASIGRWDLVFYYLRSGLISADIKDDFHRTLSDIALIQGNIAVADALNFKPEPAPEPEPELKLDSKPEPITFAYNIRAPIPLDPKQNPCEYAKFMVKAMPRILKEKPLTSLRP